MLKISALDATSKLDESGRKILISTGPRLYFRKELSTPDNDYSKTPNSELNELIASDVAGAKNVKTFTPKSSDIASGKRDIGVIKKSSQFGVFYICIAGSDGLRVLTIQSEIRDGQAGEKMPSKVETGVLDPKRSLPIRVTTTTRKIFRQDYKSQAFPPDTTKTFDNAGIKELSEYIGNLFAKNANNVKYVWRNPNKPDTDNSGGLLEIRSFGSNSYFVSAIRDDFIDIVSVQGKFLSKKVKEQLGDTTMSPSRLGKKPRKEKHGVGSNGNPYGQR